MPSSNIAQPLDPTYGTVTQAVDEFMAQLVHPCKSEIESIRKLILGVDNSILEGIKWNSPSFRTTEYFATTNLRIKAGVGIILHLGAKVRELPLGGVSIDDPHKLLKWLAKDRASIEFTGMNDVLERCDAFQSVLRQWIAYV
jgi:Domain of unknown function (DU1801)